MITIPWDPDLVLGSIRISWHSLFAFVAMVVGSLLSIRLSRWIVKDDRVYPFALAVIVGGLIGARIAHIVDNPATYGADIGKMLSPLGGIGTVGAPLGSTITGYLAARVLRLPRGFMFDVTVVGIALGEAIGRLGDIVNGEHHGTACAPPLGVCVGYTSPATLGQAGPVHFIGLYDCLLMVVTFALLWAMWHRVRGRPPEGRVWAGYLVLFGFGRFVESYLREDPRLVFGLQEAHILGLGYAIAGALYLYWASRRAENRAIPD